MHNRWLNWLVQREPFVLCNDYIPAIGFSGFVGCIMYIRIYIYNFISVVVKCFFPLWVKIMQMHNHNIFLKVRHQKLIEVC